jgi:hypothetical protein
MLAGCGSSSYSSDSGPVSSNGGTATGTGSKPVTGSAGGEPGSGITGAFDSIVGTPSVSGPLTVAIGTTQTLSVTFTSSDGQPITGFAISGTMLPAGWSGPNNFSCSTVSTGSGCVLNLTYSPTAADSGSFTISYIFINNAKMPVTTGTPITISYVAAAANDIVATPAPIGQITAATGSGSQSVSVSFTTDDGKLATDLSVTSSLGSLPAGWSSTASNFSCAIVTTGSGCELPLTFAPKTGGSGTLTVNYSYVDGTGASRSGAVNIPYATTSSGNIVASAAPMGQINAALKGGGQAVAITFDTDDGKTATNLALSGSSTVLPTGWSGDLSAFSCASVSTGNGCQLRLNYAPTALGSGTLTVGYNYTDAAGAAQTGSVNLAYAATTNDNVVGTVSPSGQVVAVAGSTAPPVVITFTSDDARTATALQLTTNLATLPAGWSSTASSFSCTGVTSGTGCQLTLSYSPAGYGSGTLHLAYSYINNAGEAKTGTVAIPYRATTDDTIVGTPSQTAVSVLTGNSATVNITFVTNDTYPASALAVTSGLNPLPAGWSAASTSFTCASVSNGTVCQLPLNFAPTAAASGTLTLGYGYTNDAGMPGTGSVSVTYTATQPYLYVTNTLVTSLSACPIYAGTTLLACTSTGTGIGNDVALDGNYAYVTDPGNVNAVVKCGFPSPGTLNNCSPTGPSFNTLTAIATAPAAPFAYVGQSNGISICAVSATDGSLSGCTVAGATVGDLQGVAISADGTHLYAVNVTTTPGTPPTTAYAVEVCSIAGDGTLSSCQATGPTPSQATASLTIHDGYLYLLTANGGLSSCAINADATLGACQSTAPGSNPTGLAFYGNTAFLGTGGTSVLSCPVNADGTFGACSSFSDPSFNGTAGLTAQ